MNVYVKLLIYQTYICSVFSTFIYKILAKIHLTGVLGKILLVLSFLARIVSRGITYLFLTT